MPEKFEEKLGIGKKELSLLIIGILFTIVFLIAQNSYFLIIALFFIGWSIREKLK